MFYFCRSERVKRKFIPFCVKLYTVKSLYKGETLKQIVGDYVIGETTVG